MILMVSYADLILTFSRENDGQQVGQGARRKVRGLTTSITGPSTSSSSTIIVSEEVNNSESHKSL